MCPDLRLGQLLVNAAPSGMDLFYVEDEDLACSVEIFGGEKLSPADRDIPGQLLLFDN
jgi:hypothetical protein